MMKNVGMGPTTTPRSTSGTSCRGAGCRIIRPEEGSEANGRVASFEEEDEEEAALDREFGRDYSYAYYDGI